MHVEGAHDLAVWGRGWGNDASSSHEHFLTPEIRYYCILPYLLLLLYVCDPFVLLLSLSCCMCCADVLGYQKLQVMYLKSGMDGLSTSK